MNPCLLLTVPFFFTCYLLQAQVEMDCQTSNISLRQILDRHAEAMGGREAWRNLHSYELHSSGANGSKTISYAQKPNRMRYDFTSPNGKLTKSYDGHQGWLLRNGAYEPMRPGEEIEMAEEPEFYEELIFAQKNKHEVQLLGMEQLDGRQCVYKIQLIKSPVDTQSYWIDPDTYLISMTGEYSEDPAHAGIYYKTTFSDFRSVDGLMFPFKMGLIANNRPPILFSYDEIKVNVVFPKGFFTQH